MKTIMLLRHLILALFLLVPAVGSAQWRSMNLEDKVLAYLQKPDANFSDAQDVLKTFIKDGRTYDVKTAQIVQIIEDYTTAHPNDADVKEKARRLGNQAIDIFENQKTKFEAAQVSTGMRVISSGAGSLIGLAMTIIPFISSGAPEIVWVPPMMAIAGWVAAPFVADRVIKRIPILKRAMTYDDADLVVKKMNDFLGSAALCRGTLNQ